jgi:autotransporter adhesin
VDQFNSGIGGVRRKIDKVEGHAYRGIAGVAAMSAGAAPGIPGKFTINLGVGGYKGEAAGAITASKVTADGRFNFNIGVGITSSAPVVGAGVGFSF